MAERIRVAVLAIMLVGAGVLAGSMLHGFRPWAATPSDRDLPSLAVEDEKAVQRDQSSAARELDQRALQLSAPRAARQAGATDVVIITLDTTRADYLEPYGSTLPTSPFLAALAKQGVTFKRAYATAGWTSPSMASLMTGLYPSEHAVEALTSQGGAASPTELPVLAQEALTVAEIVQGAGYRTFGVCTNLLVSQDAGFGQGFDVFVGRDTIDKPFPRIAVESIRDQLLSSERYLLWVHYFDAHWPYREQAPWFQRWNDSEIASDADLLGDAAQWLYRYQRGLSVRGPIPPGDLTQLADYAQAFVSDPSVLFAGIRALTSESERAQEIETRMRFLRAAYRSELRANDEDLRRVFETIGVDDETLVIVTADHGEELLEHGNVGHSAESLYEELIHIPLVIRLPGGRHGGRVVDAPVSLVDVVPTLLDLLHLPIPEQMSGRSVVDLLSGTVDERPRELIAELKHSSGHQYRSVLRYPWKYIHRDNDGHGELYNLEVDPHEWHDLSEVESARAGELRDFIVDWAARATPRWKRPVPFVGSTDDSLHLRALGYTGH